MFRWLSLKAKYLQAVSCTGVGWQQGHSQSCRTDRLRDGETGCGTERQAASRTSHSSSSNPNSFSKFPVKWQFWRASLAFFTASSVASPTELSLADDYCKPAEQLFHPHRLLPAAHSAFIPWPHHLSKMTIKITFKYPARFWSCRSWSTFSQM